MFPIMRHVTVLNDNAEMYEPGSEAQSESREVRLVQEVLESPDLQHENKGRREREVLRYLLSLYQQDPSRIASEDDIAIAVYGNPANLGDSLVRRTISRVRDRLDKHCEQLDVSRPLRVKIPEGRYRLEFENIFLRYGVSPTRWFWDAYFDNSRQVSFDVVQGPRIPHQNSSLSPCEICTLDALTFYRQFSAMLGRLPNIASMSDDFSNPHMLILSEPGAEVDFGIETIKDSFGSRPLESFLDPAHRCAVSDPTPSFNGPSVYVQSIHETYGLLTRFTLPSTQEAQTTIITGPNEIVSRIMRRITSDEDLFTIVTSGELAGAELDRARAPIAFQILFSLRLDYPSRQESLRAILSRVLSSRPVKGKVP
jgi:hypothetical protein